MRICVFAGSGVGNEPAYRQAATDLGAALAAAKLSLVFGGSALGLMGALADGALANRGEIIGVIPKALNDTEGAHPGVANIRVVASMHERKATQLEMADGFVALPGGLGTLEELFEAWTWAHLGYHSKPCALLNVSGFFDGLLGFLDGAVEKGFIRKKSRDLLIVQAKAEDLVAELQKRIDLPS